MSTIQSVQGTDCGYINLQNIRETEKGYQNIVIHAVETMLILLLAYSYLLIGSGAISIMVQFRVGHDIRFCDIFELQKEIGAKKYFGLTFFILSVDVIPHQAFSSMSFYGLLLTLP